MFCIPTTIFMLEFQVAKYTSLVMESRNEAERDWRKNELRKLKQALITYYN